METQRMNMDSPAEELASEFLEAWSRGAAPITEEWVVKLDAEDDRAEFRRILRYAMTVESLPPTSIREGEMFGPYRIVAQIGTGGMGTVYHARDTRLPRDVAIKVLSPERTGSTDYQQRLTVESRVLAQLNHPNIVAVHEADEIAGVRYLVMDYVDGTPLDVVVERLAKLRGRKLTGADIEEAIGKPLPPGHAPIFEAGDDYYDAVAKIMRQIVRALEAAHAHGVLHRDLKPGNVMLTGGGNPIVLDFGLAGSQRVDGVTISDRLLGSVPYFAPEQLRDMRIGFDLRTDVYQLGLIFYELLTLELAFPADTMTGVLRNIEFGQMKRPRKRNTRIPHDLETICLVASEPDLGRRFASATELGSELDHYLAGRPLTIRSPSVLRRIRLFSRRNAKPLAAGALALVAGSATAWFYWQVPVRPTLERRFAINIDTMQRRAEPMLLRPREMLGGSLQIPRRVHLFAISVFGKRLDMQGETWVRVLEPKRTDELARADVEFGREWKPGTHEVFLWKHSARLDPDVWEEAIHIYSTEHGGTQGQLQRWHRRIHAAQDGRGEPGVPYATAMQWLAEKTRGDPPLLTREQLERLRKARPDGAWQKKNLSRIAFRFRVRAR